MKPNSEYFMSDCHRPQPYKDRDIIIVDYLTCWHVDNGKPIKWNETRICAKCNRDMTWGNPNLSTPNGYFWLLDVMKEISTINDFQFFKSLPTPDEFADWVYEIIMKLQK